MAAKVGYKLLVDLTPVDVPYLCNIVAMSERSPREDAGRVARFIAALADRMQFNRSKSNKDESMRILAKYVWVPLDRNRAMIEKGCETYRDMMLKKPYADPSAMKLLVEMIAESNPKAKSINVASLVDSTFVERLDREGAFDR